MVFEYLSNFVVSEVNLFELSNSELSCCSSSDSEVGRNVRYRSLNHVLITNLSTINSKSNLLSYLDHA